ncbi:hypothetical protein PPERSA_12575 [Pseudocohnilembus persalinus]|uniref:Uncharacterized protein n=1 Tax=Pseudocohnilembus persalinus TaxID=266149 RepID=A0A0V0QCP0_PSEPJ|nr:hypothetical protein PPERSA_12575 [Pseudocohnilembus persalinus]|eukprot:KRW99899.1 hypothetical protein PPERSA_12575 [Pseudocohnilembus persalinus]
MDENEQKQKQVKIQKIEQQELAKKKLKHKIGEKHEIIQNLQTKLDLLQQEHQQIQGQYQIASSKYQKGQKSEEKNVQQIQQSSIKQDEQQRFAKQVTEKINFLISRYIIPIEKHLKSTIESYFTEIKQNKIQIAQKAQFSSIQVILTKRQTNFVLGKKKRSLLKPSNNSLQENSKLLIGKVQSQQKRQSQTNPVLEYSNNKNNNDKNEFCAVFRISKDTTFEQIKKQAVIFWELPLGNNLKEPTKREISKEINMYILLDKNGKQIPIDQKVEKYFINTTELTEATVYMKPISQVKNNQDEQKEDLKNYINNSKKTTNEYIQIWQQLVKSVPYIDRFFIVSEKSLEEKWKNNKSQKRKGFRFDDNHCCFFFLVVIMLILIIFQITYGIRLNIMQKHNAVILDKLQIQRNFKEKDYTTWVNIDTFDKFENYLLNSTFRYELFRDPDMLDQYEGSLLSFYTKIGQIQIRQLRSKSYDCSEKIKVRKNTQKKCYYDDWIDNQETEQIEQGIYDWQKYKPLLYLNETRYTEGKFSKYPPNGYLYKKGNEIKNDGEFYTDIQNAFENGFIDNSIRGLIINVNLFNQNDGYMVFIELLLEQDQYGLHAKSEVIAFLPNLHESTYGNRLQTLKNLRLFFTIIQAILLLYRLTCYNSIDLQYIFSIQGCLNLVIIVCSFMSISYEYQLDNMNITYDFLEEIKQNNYFYDFGEAAYQFQKIVQIQSLILGAIIIRLVLYFTFFKPFDLIIQTIENSIIQIFVTFIFIFFVIIGFVLLALNFLKYNQYFTTFSDAFINLLLIIIGVFDFNSIEFNFLSVLFLGLYIFIIGFFLMNIIVAIYIDQYRQVYLQNGYQTDADWTLKERFKWFFSWLGESNLQKLGFND